MKLALVCLLFALTLSAQVITQDSVVNRLNSALETIDRNEVQQPISMVIAVQTNYKIQAAIAINFRKIGALLQPLVSSGRGEIEVLSYGDRVRVFVAQPFTADSAKAAQAMAYLKITSGLQNSASNILDVIAQATSDLETRASNRRRIILVVGENSTDRESEAKLKDVLDRAAERLPNLAVLFPLAF
jgi:hypothetical protein